MIDFERLHSFTREESLLYNAYLLMREALQKERERSTTGDHIHRKNLEEYVPKTYERAENLINQFAEIKKLPKRPD